MFRKDDDCIGGTPVSQQTEEILEVREKIVPASESNSDDRTEAEYRPDESRNPSERSGELLTGNCSRVGIDNVPF